MPRVQQKGCRRARVLRVAAAAAESSSSSGAAQPLPKGWGPQAAGSTMLNTGGDAAAAPQQPQPQQRDPRFASLRRVLVAGATGGTGACVVAALRAKGVPVRALARDAAKARIQLGATDAGGDVEVVEGDVTRYASVEAAMRGCDAVVVATGAGDPRDVSPGFCCPAHSTPSFAQ